MPHILGIDLGTSSIGISLRNSDIQGNITEQLEYFSVDTFKSSDKKGVSFAAARTISRLSRRLYDTRRRRLWATLDLLIEKGLCPMTKETLNYWRKFDKLRGGYSRQYPVEDIEFENWIRMDFDNDGKSDFPSPYHLRKKLVEEQLDFNNQRNKHMLGRALYHIAQRRGFKSSKGSKANAEEIVPELIEDNENTFSEELKASELRTSGKLTEYKVQHGCKTVGAAFASLLDEGIRIRGSEYKAVRSDYKNEIDEIFRCQGLLYTEPDLYRRLISTKKGEGTIFYKKSATGQKGSVGKCTLEKNKSRCPVSHPVFEEFRARTFINSIRYKKSLTAEWTDLTSCQADELYHQLFISKGLSKFDFVEIRNWLEKDTGLTFSKDDGTINYDDTVRVKGCPVIARLVKLFGDNWQEFTCSGKKQRKNNAHTDRVFHNVVYTAESIWNYCFTAEEPEEVRRFAIECLEWDERKSKKLLQLWDDMQIGYAMLSQKAMKNILRFLRLGLRYPDAVLLAKVPDLLSTCGHTINEQELNSIILKYISDIKTKNTELKTYAIIANSLISSFKAIDPSEWHDKRRNDYLLQDDDIAKVEEHCKAHYGESKWQMFSDEERTKVMTEVTERYQSFFASIDRDFVRVPKLSDDIFNYLKSVCPALQDADRAKLYHPSMISAYRPMKSTDSSNDVAQLGSPNMGSIKNPVALRTLNILKDKINQMLSCRMIDPEDTRIVIETTREVGDVLDDANARTAFTHYQTQRANERAAIEKILSVEYPQRIIDNKDIDKALYVIEQHEHENWQTPYLRNEGKNKGTFDRTFSKYILKYKLWLEQGCRCMYTGRHINISNLFDDNATDIEHTIPRSLCFDNSDANLTVCDAYYNKHVKKNRIPTQMENYSHAANSYPAIEPMLEKWKIKVKHLEEMVDYWKHRSSRAQTKEDKDYAIVNRHEWEAELKYWTDKLDRFTRTDIPEKFRNSQLVDTGVITRHALAYLKSVFTNVVAQKGGVTAVFRDILGLQGVEKKKDRRLHSHHAIDATVLTMIPVGGLRSKILKLYYQKEEALKLNNIEEAHYYGRLLNERISQLNLGRGTDRINDYINENILINHRSNDRTLQNAKRIRRIGGKAVRKKDAHGNYMRNYQGKYVHEYSNGDSIRLEISAQGNLGVIVLPNKDSDGLFIKENGRYQYTRDNNGKYDYTMVQRVDIKSFEKVEDIDKIIDPIVRQSIITALNDHAGKSLKSIISEGIWMRTKRGKGEEIKVDKHGYPLSPIRHVRCKVAAGRGFLKYDSAIPLREQKYISNTPLINLDNRNHKRNVYALSTGNYVCLVYEGVYKGLLKREFVLLSNYEIAQLKHYFKHVDGKEINTFHQLEETLMTEPSFNKRTFKKTEYTLVAVIKNGYRVLQWNETPDELRELSRTELLKRLYVVEKFNEPTPSTKYVYLKKHIDADKDRKPEHYTSNQFKFLIEHRDFEIRLTSEGDTIVFND